MKRIILSSLLVVIFFTVYSQQTSLDSTKFNLFNPADLYRVMVLPKAKIDSMEMAFEKFKNKNVPVTGMDGLPNRLKKKMKSCIIKNMETTFYAIKHPQELEQCITKMQLASPEIEKLMDDIFYEKERQDIINSYKEEAYASKDERKKAIKEMKKELKELKDERKEDLKNNKTYKIK
jgi:hypothetical protein